MENIMDWFKVDVNELLFQDVSNEELIARLKVRAYCAHYESIPPRNVIEKIRKHNRVDVDIEMTYIKSDIESVIKKREREKKRYSGIKEYSKILPTEQQADCQQNNACSVALSASADKIRLDQTKQNKIILNTPDKSGESVEEIMYIWNEFAERNGLSKILKISDVRKKAIMAREKEKEFDLDQIFSEILRSDFLLGRNGDWKIDFDFVFCSKNNYLKILEGKYSHVENKSSPMSTQKEEPCWEELRYK